MGDEVELGGFFEEGVDASGDDFEGGVDSGFGEFFVEDGALCKRDDGVGVAMDEEEGWGGLGDMEEGGGEAGEVVFFGEGSAEEEADGFGGGFFVGFSFLGGLEKEVGGAEVGADRLDGAGGVLVSEGTFELGVSGGGGEEGDEVASGGGAPDADAVGVDIVLGGVLAEVADGGLAVVDLSGEGVGAGEAVVGGGDGEAGFEKAGLAGEDFFVSVFPSSAVDPQDEGELGGGLVGAGGEVEVESVADVAVFDVGDVFENFGSFGDGFEGFGEAAMDVVVALVFVG